MRVEVVIDGKPYPCSPTLGANLRFKKETGKEVTEIDGKSLSDLAIYLFCCVASACNREKIPFYMTLEDFADGLDLDTVNEWSKSIMVEEGDKKKR